MSRRNRVTPLGEIVAIDLRGAWTGNRGILHRDHEIVRSHASDLWITCALRFKDRWREQWLPHHFTWLYFHDEAVSFAAGHRPCGECRRADYVAYRALWSAALSVPLPSAKQLNRQLHAERNVRGTSRRRLHDARWRQLPDGAFVLLDDAPWLVLGDELVEWTHAGYRTRRARPRGGSAVLITPPSTVEVLRAGYPVQLDPSSSTPSPLPPPADQNRA